MDRLCVCFMFNYTEILIYFKKKKNDSPKNIDLLVKTDLPKKNLIYIIKTDLRKLKQAI